jgi:hypothetical protein
MLCESARFHLAHAIALRFPPGPERDAWLAWLQLDDVARRRALVALFERVDNSLFLARGQQ